MKGYQTMIEFNSSIAFFQIVYFLQIATYVILNIGIRERQIGKNHRTVKSVFFLFDIPTLLYLKI